MDKHDAVYKVYERDLEDIINKIMRPTIQAGGREPDIMVLLQSVCTGVIGILCQDDKELFDQNVDLLCKQVKLDYVNYIQNMKKDMH